MKLFTKLLAMTTVISILSVVTLPALSDAPSPSPMTAEETVDIPPAVNAPVGDGANNSDSSSGDSSSQEDIFTLTGFREQLFPHWKEVILLEADQELDPESLPEQIAGLDNLICTCDDGSDYAIPVTWSTEVPGEPGLYNITGTLSLYDDTVLAEDFDGIETWPVFRLGEGAVLDAAVELPSMVDPLIRQDGDPSVDVSFALPEARVLVGEDAYLPVDIAWSWDWSSVAPDTLGQYTVTGTLTGAPDWVCLPEEELSVSFPVYVLPGDRIEIYALLHLYQDHLNIGWLYESSCVSDVVLEQQTGDGQWEACPESWYLWSSWAPRNLHLYLMEFPTETDIVLRLRYQDVIDGSAVERFSEPITLNVPANIAEILAEGGGQVPDDMFNGDRDGGDSGGTDLPDYEQPAPEWSFPEWEPPEEDTPAWLPEEEEEETVIEIVTDTYTALSGLRLEQLTRLGDTVLFEKQGAAVEIPSHLLEDLELKDWELLEVSILRPTGNAVEVEILADGERVTDLSGTVIRLPWDPADGTDLQVVDLFGTVIGEAVYEEGGTVWSVIDHPGIYLVLAVAAVQEPSAQEPPVGEPVPDPPEEPESTQTPDAEEPVPELSPAITPETNLEEAEEPVSIVPEEAASTETPDAEEPEPEFSPSTTPEADPEEAESTQTPDAEEPVPEFLPAVTPEADPEERVPEPPAAPEKEASVSPWWLVGLLLLAGLAAFLWRRRRHG